MSKQICEHCYEEYDNDELFCILGGIGDKGYECIDKTRCKKNYIKHRINQLNEEYKPKLHEDFIYIVSNCPKCGSSNVKDGFHINKCKECYNIFEAKIEWLNEDKNEEYFVRANLFHKTFYERYQIKFDDLEQNIDITENNIYDFIEQECVFIYNKQDKLWSVEDYGYFYDVFSDF